MAHEKRAMVNGAIAFCLAGSATLPGKVIAGKGPLLAQTALGLAFALATLLPLAARSGARLRDLRAELPGILLQAVFGIVLYRLCLLGGLATTGAAEAGVLLGAVPAFSALFGAVFLRERPGKAGIAAGLLIAAGAALVAAGRGGGAGGWAGAGLVLGAALSESIFNVLGRAGAGRLPPIARSCAVVAAALAICAGLGPLEGGWGFVAALGPAEWAAFAYYGVLVTAAAYVAWYRCVAALPVARAAAFGGLMPVASLVLAVLVLGERPGPACAGGAGLVAAGLFLSARRPT